MPIGHLYTTRRPITVEAFVLEFGPKLDDEAQPRLRPRVICIACGCDMHTIGEAGPLRDATWGHNPSTTWCPVKESAAKPYEVLAPTAPDVEAGRILRERFFRNWTKHWEHVNDIVRLSDIYTFISFIKRCDRLAFWCQPGLEEWFIPYVFLATCDFPPPKGIKGKASRPEWVRCCFDARVRDSKDLWIRTTGDWGFVIATYRAPTRGEPRAKDLISLDEITPRPTFLATTSGRANTYQSDAMARAFPGLAI